MINEEKDFNDDQIIKFIELNKFFLNMDETLKVIIRKDKMILLEWAYQQQNFVFDIKYYSYAINWDSIDVALYFYSKYTSLIRRDLKYLIKEIVLGIQRSNRYFFVKISLL